ncbi:hypothetical protein [Limosilactobacillus coleohominis]|uniref:Uncharacterized protein n=1 Tax=Limosilactobacillus coleohominis TaxID=181675 RepID=A0ABS2GW66_9LACO|nr:hypothetical protein [Limosilactobacillus coleohominis]MBM6940051.1 hypothetical protein [Limosilactobacillus coleohominis]
MDDFDLGPILPGEVVDFEYYDPNVADEQDDDSKKDESVKGVLNDENEDECRIFDEPD